MKKPIVHRNNQVHKTVCDICHKPCEVPFKPNGKKPVLCDACFAKTRDVAPVEGSYVRRKDKMVFETPENFVASTFTGPKTDAQATDIKIAELKRELSSANAKLDKLIDMFSKFKQK